MRHGGNGNGDGRRDGGESYRPFGDETDLDEEFDLGDGTADREALVYCPVCGEPNQIGLDPGSGALQEYVEDCQVCCRPWLVRVRYRADGSAEVFVTAEEGDEWG